MFKAVVTDLDGTLLNSQHRVSGYTREVIRAVSQKNVALIIASGRHYADVKYISRDLDLEIFLISSNGARVHDRQGGLFYKQDLDADIIDVLLKLPLSNGIHINLYREQDWLVQEPREALLEYHRDSGFAYTIVDFSSSSRQGVAKVFFHGDHEKLVEVERKLRPLLSERASMTYSTPQSLEIMAPGVSKGSALKSVLHQKGVLPAETIAFGDGPNDAEMLRAAGKGVLMSNASVKTKALLPELEVTLNNDQDAVARYLERLFL